MKTRTVHRLLAFLLTVVTMLPLLGLDGLATGTAAIDETTYAGIIETEALSSIRYSTPTGLRFLSTVNRTWLEEIYDHKQQGRIKDFSFGTYIAPADYFTEGVTWDSLETDKQKLDVEATYGAYYSHPDLDPEKAYVAGSIVNIYRHNYNRAFRATGYVRILLLDGTVVEYLGDDHVAKVAETAAKVINADHSGEYVIPDEYLPVLKQFIQPTDKEMNITNLQTNQTNDPMGIDDTQPTLSWEVSSTDRAVSQTAYRVVVASDLEKLNAGEYDMWDSGRVEASDVMVKYGGAALTSSTRYYWTVFVWDQDGVLCLPAAYASFEMGLLDEDDWAGVEWISIDPTDESLGAMARLTSYIIEFDTTIVTQRMAVAFGGVDASNCYMWLIYADKGQLIPHIRVNGKWTVNTAEVPSVTMDPATILGEGKTSFLNEALHVKIQVDNGTITTYINGIQVQQLQNSTYPMLGKFGFRAAGAEQFYADNFTIADASGTVLYREEFSSPFDAGLAGTLKENQLLSTGNVGRAGNPEPIFFSTDLYDAETIGALTEYTIEMDAKIVDRNLGIIFGAEDAKNCYMWLFMTSSTTSGSNDNMLNAHIRTNGSWKLNSLKSDFNYTSTMKGKTVHLKIEVSNGIIKTYVGDVLVNTFEDTQYSTLGRFGFRASYSSTHGAEEAYVDNFVIKAGVGTNATVVFEESFDLEQLASNHYATITNDSRLFIEKSTSQSPFFFSDLSYESGNAYYLEDYEIAFDTKITNVATCVTFGGYDETHCYMWCFHSTQGKLLMHSRNGGGWTSIGSAVIPTDVLGGTSGMVGKDLHVQIKKSGDEISTYINGVLISTVTDTLYPTLGKVGFRASYSSKTGHETSYIDNFVIKDHAGVPFYTQDFETLDLSEIFASPTDCEIVTETDEDGNPDKKLYLGASAEGDNVFFFDHTRIGISFNNTTAPMLRKEFAVSTEKEIASARLYATATGVYEMYINGAKVGDDYLNPGSTEFVDRAMYQTFDVTAMLNGGDNAIAGMVGTGWYNGTRWGFGSVNALYAKLVIRYTDGSEDIISTDGSWRCYGDGPIRMNDLIDGEDYDARYEVDGWTTDAFDDADWGSAKVYTQSALNVGSVSAQIGSTIKLVEERSPIAVTEPLPGVYVYDFGQNFSGIVRITATAPSGTVMTLRFAEMLNHADAGVDGCDGPAGTIYTENLRIARAADVYTFRGNEEGETYCPIFTYHGFRYLEITGIDKDAIVEVTALVLSSATGENGSLETSNALVDQFYSNLKWGLLSNCFSIPTDCNQRNERHGWTSEAQLISRSATYIFDHYAFMSKYMQDIRDTQKADGLISEVAPTRSGTNSATTATNSYGDAAVIIPWQMYQQYGDVTILEENWECIKLYIQHLHDTSTDFLRDAKGYGDWLNMGETTPVVYINTTWCYYSCSLAARIASIVGTPEDVARFTEWAQGYRSAWTAEYIDNTGHLNVKTQTAYAMALEFGLVEGELAKNAADDLAANVVANGYRLTTGTSGTSFLLPALSHNGYSDLAYKLLEQTECPSWLYMVTQGATTVWERYNGFTEEDGFGPASMNSFNHPVMGSAVEWIYRSMLGIERDEENPGYKHFFLQPEIGGTFTYVRGSFASSYGTIFSGWELSEDGLLTYTCTVPANTTATLRLPAPTSGVVREGDALAKNAYGVTYVGIEGECVVYELESGSYSFTLQIK